MSDTIVVMSRGEIQQIGTPVDIYNEPANSFVADFIGESNITPGVMLKDYLCRFRGYDFPCLDAGFAPNEEVEVVVRPEDIDIVPVDKGMLTCTDKKYHLYGRALRDYPGGCRWHGVDGAYHRRRRRRRNCSAFIWTRTPFMS